MEEKLKLISRQIPWSLAVKALIFGFAWYLLPFYIFVAVALYFYLVPLYKPIKFLVPFLTFLVLLSPYFFSRSLALAFFASVFFFLLLGVKDLVFIGRRHAYEIVVLLVSFLLFLVFFYKFQEGGMGMIIVSLIVFGVFYLMIKNLLQYHSSFLSESEVLEREKSLIFPAFSVFLLWQLSFILYLLPFSYPYRASILFLASFVVSELNMAYFNGKLSRRKILFSFTIFFIFIVLALVSNKWEL